MQVYMYMFMYMFMYMYIHVPHACIDVFYDLFLPQVDLSKFSWSKLKQDYDRLLNFTVEPPQMISYKGRSLYVPLTV